MCVRVCVCVCVCVCVRACVRACVCVCVSTNCLPKLITVWLDASHRSIDSVQLNNCARES